MGYSVSHSANQSLNYVFDLDGTIVFHNKPLATEIAQALDTLVENGHKVIFATARPLRDTLPLLPESLTKQLIIGCNGSMISERAQVTQYQSFSIDASAKLLAYLESNKIPFVADSVMQFCLSSQPDNFHQRFDSVKNYQVSVQDMMAQPVTKMIVLDYSQLSIIEQFVKSEITGYAIYHHLGEGSFDIVPSQEETTNKATALEKFGIDWRQTACFGNDHNDIEMLNRCQWPHVVGDKILLERQHVKVDEKRIDQYLSQMELNRLP